MSNRRHRIVFVSCCLLFAAFTSARQAAPPGPSGTPAASKPAAVRAWEMYSERLLAAAEAMPEDGWESRLAPGVRSFAEAVGHSIDTNFGVCAGARRLENPKKGQTFEQPARPKAELIAGLRDAFAYCATFVTEAAAAGTHASDVGFLNTHNAQMLVLLDAQLIARGLPAGRGSEAAKRPPASLISQ